MLRILGQVMHRSGFYRGGAIAMSAIAGIGKARVFCHSRSHGRYLDPN